MLFPNSEENYLNGLEDRHYGPEENLAWDVLYNGTSVHNQLQNIDSKGNKRYCGKTKEANDLRAKEKIYIIPQLWK